MITFWVDPSGAFGPEEYLRGRGEPLADRFTVRPYQWDRETLEVTTGPQIFSGLDQLTEPELRGVTEIRGQLAALAPGMTLLNDPVRCLFRQALLDTLADRGINRFRAYPSRQADRITRFPVFIRGERDHGGSFTDLLHSQRDLERALFALRFRGHGRDDLLIVEFCDTVDSAGNYRKYSAFRVGNAIVPAHVMRGAHWVVKSEGSDRTRELVEEDLAFIEENPHEQWLREVFTLAGVEYGRMDYGVMNGVPQVWEINLNPTLGRRAGKTPIKLEPEVAALRERARTLAHAKLREAFAALDTGEPSRKVTLSFRPEIRSAVASATRKRRRRQRVIELLRRSYESPIGAPLRALLPRAFPHR